MANIQRGGVFNDIYHPANYWGQCDRRLPARPLTERLGFKWLGPFAQGARNMLIGFGNNATLARRAVSPYTAPMLPGPGATVSVTSAPHLPGLLPQAAIRPYCPPCPPCAVAPPAAAVAARPLPPGPVPVGPADYGRDWGAFRRPVRSCGPERYVTPGMTPRGGVLDGATVGGPLCTFGEPKPPAVPMLAVPTHVVPEARAARQLVPFQRTPAMLTPFGMGPDGLF